eukprot:g3443.t1
MCPQCGEMVSRERMQTHQRESCPGTEVGCPFAFVGCEWKGSRADLAGHLSLCDAYEKSLASSGTKKLQQEQTNKDQRCRFLVDPELESMTMAAGAAEAGGGGGGSSSSSSSSSKRQLPSSSSRAGSGGSRISTAGTTVTAPLISTTVRNHGFGGGLLFATPRTCSAYEDKYKRSIDFIMERVWCTREQARGALIAAENDTTKAIQSLIHSVPGQPGQRGQNDQQQFGQQQQANQFGQPAPHQMNNLPFGQLQNQNQCGQLPHQPPQSSQGSFVVVPPPPGGGGFFPPAPQQSQGSVVSNVNSVVSGGAAGGGATSSVVSGAGGGGGQAQGQGSTSVAEQVQSNVLRHQLDMVRRENDRLKREKSEMAMQNQQMQTQMLQQSQADPITMGQPQSQMPQSQADVGQVHQQAQLQQQAMQMQMQQQQQQQERQQHQQQLALMRQQLQQQQQENANLKKKVEDASGASASSRNQMKQQPHQRAQPPPPKNTLFHSTTSRNERDSDPAFDLPQHDSENVSVEDNARNRVPSEEEDLFNTSSLLQGRLRQPGGSSVEGPRAYERAPLSVREKMSRSQEDYRLRRDEEALEVVDSVLSFFRWSAGIPQKYANELDVAVRELRAWFGEQKLARDRWAAAGGLDEEDFFMAGDDTSAMDDQSGDVEEEDQVAKGGNLAASSSTSAGADGLLLSPPPSPHDLKLRIFGILLSVVSDLPLRMLFYELAPKMITFAADLLTHETDGVLCCDLLCEKLVARAHEFYLSEFLCPELVDADLEKSMLEAITQLLESEWRPRAAARLVEAGDMGADMGRFQLGKNPESKIEKLGGGGGDDGEGDDGRSSSNRPKMKTKMKVSAEVQSAFTRAEDEGSCGGGSLQALTDIGTRKNRGLVGGGPGSGSFSLSRRRARSTSRGRGMLTRGGLGLQHGGVLSKSLTRGRGGGKKGILSAQQELANQHHPDSFLNSIGRKRPKLTQLRSIEMGRYLLRENDWPWETPLFSPSVSTASSFNYISPAPASILSSTPPEHVGNGKPPPSRPTTKSRKPLLTVSKGNLMLLEDMRAFSQSPYDSRPADLKPVLTDNWAVLDPVRSGDKVFAEIHHFLTSRPAAALGERARFLFLRSPLGLMCRTLECGASRHAGLKMKLLAIAVQDGEFLGKIWSSYGEIFTQLSNCLVVSGAECGERIADMNRVRVHVLQVIRVVMSRFSSLAAGAAPSACAVDGTLSLPSFSSSYADGLIVLFFKTEQDTILQRIALLAHHELMHKRHFGPLLLACMELIIYFLRRGSVRAFGRAEHLLPLIVLMAREGWEAEAGTGKGGGGGLRLLGQALETAMERQSLT